MGEGILPLDLITECPNCADNLAPLANGPKEHTEERLNRRKVSHYSPLWPWAVDVEVGMLRCEL